MSVKVAVCAPHRPVDDEREANWQRTRQQWQGLGWPVYTGNNEDTIFSRSKAINLAAAQAPDSDVLLVTDTDILLWSPQQAVTAAEEAFAHTAYVVAFGVLYVLDWEDTRAVRAGAEPSPKMAIETLALIWGGLFAVSRKLFDRVGGFDERFTGWGAQDIGFMVACSTLGEKRRVQGDAYHLRHNPVWADPANNPTRLEDNALGSRYLAADGDIAQITAILASAHE
jgi:hypothetical protein